MNLKIGCEDFGPHKINLFYLRMCLDELFLAIQRYVVFRFKIDVLRNCVKDNEVW